MILYIKKQESYSRGELLLRTIFGWLYIVIPHTFLLFFTGIWAAILQFIAFWVILFTGRYPQSFFEFQEKNIRWSIRVNARIYNLADEYPAFGLNGTDEHTAFHVTYPEKLSRGKALLKFFFGWLYVAIPHGFILYFYTLLVFIISFLAFWAVLFTGKYPESFHRLIVEYIRWSTRVQLYLAYMTDTYPPFSGSPTAEEINFAQQREINTTM